MRLPDGSRSQQSVWVWRGFFLMSLIGAGLALSFADTGRLRYCVAWSVISAGWFAISMWLWRRHVQFDAQAVATSRPDPAMRRR